MHTSRVIPSLVDTKRLDPEFYRPEHLETERVLKGLNAEPLKRAGSFWAGPFGSELPSSLYLNQGIPLFRVSNVGSMQVLYDGMAYLDPIVHQQLAASEVRPGDLLVVKASVGEKICRIPDSMPRANITQHIIALRPNGRADSDYLSAFLFGRYGRSQLVRRSLGSIIQYLGVNDARTVLYPPFDRRAQTYIGDKVRQAGRLREYAEKRSRSLNDLERNLIPAKTPECSRRKGWRIVDRSISENRLDSKFYSEHFIKLAAEIASNEYLPLIDCLSGIRYGASVPANYVQPGMGMPFVRGTELERNRISRENAVNLAPDLTNLIGGNTVREGDVLITRSGTVGIAAPVPASLVGAAYGSFMMRLTPKGEWPAGYLSWCLNSWLGRNQIERLENGAVQLNINVEELGSVKIWRAPIEERLEIERQLLAWNSALDLAESLIKASSVLIDCLIEGHISEGEIIAVQSAIERGEYTPEREFLACLSADGIGQASAPRLFADLDALYRTVQEADSSLPQEVK